MGKEFSWVGKHFLCAISLLNEVCVVFIKVFVSALVKLVDLVVKEDLGPLDELASPQQFGAKEIEQVLRVRFFLQKLLERRLDRVSKTLGHLDGGITGGESLDEEQAPRVVADQFGCLCLLIQRPLQ